MPLVLQSFLLIPILLAGSPCLKPFVHFMANHKLTTRAAVCLQQVSQDSFIQIDSKGTSHGWLYRECSKTMLFIVHSHITQIKRQTSKSKLLFYKETKIVLVLYHSTKLHPIQFGYIPGSEKPNTGVYRCIFVTDFFFPLQPPAHLLRTGL